MTSFAQMMPAGGYSAPQGAYPPPQYLPQQLQQQNEQLRLFWIQQMQEVQQVGTDPAEFKNHQLPLARIKKVENGVVQMVEFGCTALQHLTIAMDYSTVSSHTLEILTSGWSLVCSDHEIGRGCPYD